MRYQTSGRIRKTLHLSHPRTRSTAALKTTRMGRLVGVMAGFTSLHSPIDQSARGGGSIQSQERNSRTL